MQPPLQLPAMQLPRVSRLPPMLLPLPLRPRPMLRLRRLPAPPQLTPPRVLTGPGWIIELKGYHFHNSDTSNEGREFIEHTLFHELEEGKVQLPDGEGGALVEVPIKDLGISYPVVITQPRIRTVNFDPEAIGSDASSSVGRPAMMSRGRNDAAADQPERKLWKLRRYDFVIQFCWQPKTRTQRREKAAAGAEPAAGTAAAAGPAAPAG